MPPRLKPGGPHNIRAQRFRWLRAINRNRAKAKHTQSSFGNKFVSFIRIQQRAVFQIELTRRPARHHILHTIEKPDPRRRFPRVRQPCAPHKSETPAVEPPVPEREFQVFVNLFEDQLVSTEILIQVALGPKPSAASVAKRFPYVNRSASC